MFEMSRFTRINNIAVDVFFFRFQPTSKYRVSFQLNNGYVLLTNVVIYLAFLHFIELPWSCMIVLSKTLNNYLNTGFFYDG